MKKTDQRGAFIDAIQAWFLQRNKFWTLTSFVSLAGVITLYLLIIMQSVIKPQVILDFNSFMLPLLALFVLSVFWRGAIPTLLSLAGAGTIFRGILYTNFRVTGINTRPDWTYNLPLVEPDRFDLISGQSLLADHLATVNTFYFLIGIFALILSLIIAMKPSVFHAKGSRTPLPYPVWSDTDPKLVYGFNPVRMIPVMALLKLEERYLIANYRYIQIMIRGSIYFTSPEDWVPEGSTAIRDKESGLLLGIPKLLGF